MKLTTFLCTFFFILDLLEFTHTSDIFEKIKENLQLAGKFLDFEQHSKAITKLVSNAFVVHEKSKKIVDVKEKDYRVFSGFLRLLGFGPRKLGAVVVNAVIFVAQLISSSFDKPSTSYLDLARQFNGTSVSDWVLNNSKIVSLFNYAKTEKLADDIVKYVEQNSLDEESGCLQLLFCKSSPFIHGMQKSVKKSYTQAGIEAFFEFLPNETEILRNAVLCDKKYPFCSLHF